MTFYEAFADELEKLSRAPYPASPFKRPETSGDFFAGQKKRGPLGKLLLPRRTPNKLSHVPVGDSHKWVGGKSLEKYRQGRLTGTRRRGTRDSKKVKGALSRGISGFSQGSRSV